VHGPVPDDAAVIGSGPTVADPSTYADAIAVLDRVHAEGAADISAAVRRRLDRGARGEIEETPKPGDPRLARSTYQVIGNRHTAMDGAAAAARSLGYEVHVFADPTSGEASLAGERFARTAARKCHVAGSPVCVIAAGETTVRVRGSGHGGRNLEFALGMAGPLEELGAAGITTARRMPPARWWIGQRSGARRAPDSIRPAHSRATTPIPSSSGWTISSSGDRRGRTWGIYTCS
jgi:hydroxypyruvate reductase